MTDILNKNIRALKLLGFERNNLSDLLLLNIILKKIDRETRKQFEQSIDSHQIPELDTFIMFLEKRSQTIDSINRSAPIVHKQKQCRNTPKILNSIPKEEQSWDFYCQSSDQTIKTLGIIWSPQFDYFSFKTALNCHESYTKREVLSIIARLFDPLGFLGQILTKAKLILQKLWVLKLEWDEPLSNSIAKEWNNFVSTLPVIQNIHVPRLVIGKGRISIHGFSDASTAAYGAVLYAQSIS
ncbi:DUF5641 domain-containing protein [Trichonephila inaurata madagascariensis]|uniref:DUF5641 domain-containing protein n=1 Tax=Trichonephila inaurata madagascariensis TaxID=2747483 RepID=A0A8X6I5N7_9ARAC|nr:DUF5641 domain-containing protein [Trichonephila inaurata madagascariensis]